jgi:hypothetical protein
MPHGDILTTPLDRASARTLQLHPPGEEISTEELAPVLLNNDVRPGKELGKTADNVHDEPPDVVDLDNGVIHADFEPGLRPAKMDRVGLFVELHDRPIGKPDQCGGTRSGRHPVVLPDRLSINCRPVVNRHGIAVGQEHGGDL